MSSVLRTLLVIDNKKLELLYGHSIAWELSELDYSIPKWRQFTTNNITVYFKDIRDESELLKVFNSSEFNLAPDINVQIPFIFSEEEEFFLEKSYQEVNFNPLIGLCSFAKVNRH